MSVKSRGLGDTIAKIASVTGIKTLVEKASEELGVPCGCAGRQKWLNEMFPYGAPTEFDVLWAQMEADKTTLCKASVLELWNALGELPPDGKAFLVGSHVARIIASQLPVICVGTGLDLREVTERTGRTQYQVTVVPRDHEELAQGFTGSLSAVVVEYGDAEMWRQHVVSGGVLAYLVDERFVIERV